MPRLRSVPLLLRHGSRRVAAGKNWHWAGPGFSCDFGFGVQEGGRPHGKLQEGPGGRAPGTAQGIGWREHAYITGKTVVSLGRTACLHFLRFWFVTVLLANDQKKWIVDTTSWM